MINRVFLIGFSATPCLRASYTVENMMLILCCAPEIELLSKEEMEAIPGIYTTPK
jgi:hypothetical protein